MAKQYLDVLFSVYSWTYTLWMRQTTVTMTGVNSKAICQYEVMECLICFPKFFTTWNSNILMKQLMCRLDLLHKISTQSLGKRIGETVYLPCWPTGTDMKALCTFWCYFTVFIFWCLEFYIFMLEKLLLFLTNTEENIIKYLPVPKYIVDLKMI